MAVTIMIAANEKIARGLPRAAGSVNRMAHPFTGTGGLVRCVPASITAANALQERLDLAV
jgi:hypothetical protein